MQKVEILSFILPIRPLFCHMQTQTYTTHKQVSAETFLTFKTMSFLLLNPIIDSLIRSSAASGSGLRNGPNKLMPCLLLPNRLLPPKSAFLNTQKS